MAKIKEIFTSIQGEGPYVGYKQLFIRLCGCNLKCRYCDTDYSSNDAKDYTATEIAGICSHNTDCHSVSLTGGEPLLQDDFINSLAKIISLPIYLETNGTLYENMANVIDSVKYICSDIKLPSSTGLSEMWGVHDKFFAVASKKELFAKVIFDENITPDEIKNVTDICNKYETELILQPMMQGKLPAVSSDFMQKTLNSFLKKYDKVRLIPQVHKYIDMM